MTPERRDAVLHKLLKTRSHIINALDGTNENSNVIKDIDRFKKELEQKPAAELTEKDVDYNFDIINREISCSLNCFTHAMQALKD